MTASWAKVRRLAAVQLILGGTSNFLSSGGLQGLWFSGETSASMYAGLVTVGLMGITLVLYVPTCIILRRGVARGKFVQGDPLFNLWLSVTAAVILSALAVMPLLEAIGRFLGLPGPHLGEGVWALYDLPFRTMSPVLLVGPLQLLRPWREPLWLLARLGAALVFALSTTDLLLLSDFGLASIALTLSALMLVLAVIRLLDGIWTSPSGGKSPECLFWND